MVIEPVIEPELPLAELRAVFGSLTGIDAQARAESIYEPVASASAGIWRVEHGSDSAVLKLIAHSETGHANWLSGADETHWYYWRREVCAYESGLLQSLPGGWRAPVCRLIAGRPDGSVALWLEDLGGETPASAWPLERYEIAARHLGRMQGAYLAGRKLPDDTWLSRNWLRDYLRQRDGDAQFIGATDGWANPILASTFPAPPTDRVRRQRADQSRFLDALDALPRTLSHLDLHPANLFSSGDAFTTAIDWSFIGLAAVGEDAGNLVPDAVLDFHVAAADIDELYELVWRGYAAGLADANVRDAEALARLGMAATIAAKYAWIAPAMLRAIAERRELLNRRPIADSLEWWAPAIAFILERADEARALTRARTTTT
jgi:hypothetical protein